MDNTLRILAGIGSRKISDKDFNLISSFAADLVKKYDCWFRSGHASGADYAFETGARDRCIVYLPFPHFNIKKLPLKTKSLIIWDNISERSKRKALTSVWDHHPRYENLTPGAMKLHARNYFQVFGSRPEAKPSQAIICCARPNGRDGVDGGTGQAVRLAKHFGIPVFNLHKDSGMEVDQIEQELKKVWGIN